MMVSTFGFVYLTAVTYGYKHTTRFPYKEQTEMTKSNNIVYLLKLGFIPLQKHPVLYLLIISSISTKHRAVHPHGVQQRPHKQARNKTSFVFWGRGAGKPEKNSITNFFPSMINY